MEPDSISPDALVVAPLAPCEPADVPWVDRVVRSPAVRSGYTSLAGHLLLCILLAILALEKKTEPRPLHLVFSVGPPTHDEPGEPFTPMEIGAADEAATGDRAAEESRTDAALPAAEEPPLVAVPPPVVDPLAERTAAEGDPSESPLASSLGEGPIAQPVSARGGSPRSAAWGGRAATRVGSAGGGLSDGKPFASRSGSARVAAVRGRGGNAASEAAVERGLDWLALHQAVDGSWQFDLSGCRCNGGCRDPGSLTRSTARTAIALLPFLGDTPTATADTRRLCPAASTIC